MNERLDIERMVTDGCPQPGFTEKQKPECDEFGIPSSYHDKAGRKWDVDAKRFPSQYDTHTVFRHVSSINKLGNSMDLMRTEDRIHFEIQEAKGVGKAGHRNGAANSPIVHQ